MKRTAFIVAMLIALSARGDETQVLPRGVFLLDVQYSSSYLDKQWDGARQAQPLLAEVIRYEPGGGLQGVITARPEVRFDILILQLMYGVTDQLTVGVLAPIVTRTRIDTHLGWREGDYQPQLGRAYSEDDFWQWAGSMGQPRPPDSWEGNQGALADMVLAARWQFPRGAFLESLGITPAASLTVALPTGRNADPEEVVAAGTNGWELHSYADVEAHLAAKKPLWIDGNGFERIALGVDLFYGWLRSRTFQAARGTKNPLLLTHQPYVGDTYEIDGGDWLGGSIVLDAALITGPTFATRVSGGSMANAQQLPALVSLVASYSYVATGQTDWRSDSPLWEFEREKQWQPGDKNIFRASLVVSLMRLGLPVQLYGSYRSQELIPGRYTRPSSVAAGGMRMLARFW